MERHPGLVHLRKAFQIVEKFIITFPAELRPGCIRRQFFFFLLECLQPLPIGFSFPTEGILFLPVNTAVGTAKIDAVEFVIQRFCLLKNLGDLLSG